MEHLLDKVKARYHHLSSALKKVALYLEAEPKSFALYSAEEVGKKVGVSETTVIRFCHALDYSGYSSLQKEVQMNIVNQKSTLKEFASKAVELDRKHHFHEKLMHTDALHLKTVSEQITEESFNLAVKKITAAHQITVVGVRSSHAMAQWFTFALNLVKGNTICYRPDVDDVILNLMQMNHHTVLVAFSFHRYALDTLLLAKAAKQRNAFVIGVTDNELAPIREHANLLLPIQLPVKSTLDTAPIVFSLMNAIISGVALENKEEFEARRKEYESLHAKSFFA